MNLVTPVLPVSPVTAEIERLGLTWHEEPNYDLELLSDERRVQCREADNYCPPQTVQEFACQMQQSIFPQIVVSRDNWLIDGATRGEACKVLKRKFYPAIVVDVDFAAATTTAKTKNTLFVLGVTLNQQNGERLTQKEKIARLPMFFALGWKVEKIMQASGLCELDIKRQKRELDIRAKLERAGLPSKEVPASKVMTFAHKSVDTLNVEPFKQLAMLAADAGLKSKEIDAVAKGAVAAGSDEGALQHLAEQRAELRDRIQAVTLTGTPVPQEPRHLRNLHLGYIIKFEGQEQELIETDPEQSARHVEALDRAIAILVKVRGMQS